MWGNARSGVFFSEVASGWLPIAFDAALKSFIVLALALALVCALRHRSAAARHLVWFLALASLPALLILSAALPSWNVLPGWAALPADDPVQIGSTRDVPEPRTVAVRPLSPSLTELGPPLSQPAVLEEGPAPPPRSVSPGDVVVADRQPIAAPPPAMAPPSRIAETESASRYSTWTWQAWYFLAWGVGAAFVLTRVVLGMVSLRCVERRADRVSGGRLGSALAELGVQMGVKREVSLLLSDRRAMPMQWGTLRPRLLLPASARGWAADRLRVVLLHELAHVRRLDCLAQMIAQVVGAAFWFNPLVWVARREMQRAGESAADDLTLNTGFRPSDYAEHVLQIASGFRADRATAWGAIAMAGPSRLEGRLLAILDPKRDRRNVSRLIIAGLVAAAFVTVVPLAMLRAASERTPARDRAEVFIGVLKEHRYGAAAELFDPTLLEVFPPKELERIWHEFERKKRAGAFEGAISYEQQQFPGGRLLAVRCRWEKAVMVIRLVFDGEDRIAGFWLARDREGPTPEHFRKGGYMFGAATERVAGLDHTLSAAVVGVDGKKLKSAVLTLWTAVEGSPGDDRRVWNDPDSDRRWKRAEGGAGAGWTDGRFTWRRLPPGTYRVTAKLGHTVTLPLGLSESVRLDRKQKDGTVSVKMVAGPSLTIHTIDADTGEPLTGTGIRLKRDDGRRPHSIGTGTKSEATVRIDDLPPGHYTLSVVKPSHHPLVPRYVPEREAIDVEMVAGEDREITVALKATSLSPEEIDQRWPWIAEGTVTDVEGHPLEGVDIRAYVGFRSHGPSGTATTDSRGHYTLRFTRGGIRLTNPPGDPPVQIDSGRLHAWKDGYVEQNLNRHAWVIAASRMPKDEDWQNYKHLRRDDERVVLPGKPHRVDFVMAAEVAITGRLVDGRDKPIANRVLRITDASFRPQDSGLTRVGTDEEGRFVIEKVPPRWNWWFTLSPAEAKWTIRSLPFRFERSGAYEMLLRLIHDDATGIDFVEFARVTDAEGNDVCEEVVDDAPLGRPPVEPELQAKGREILADVAEANRYWLSLPPEEVTSYRYRFFASGTGPGRGTKEYEVRDDSGESFPAREMEYAHSARHGITYYSALHYMTAHPQDVAFRQVEIDEDEIRLAYCFKDRVWLAASCCLFVSRNGFFISHSNIREGTLVLDRQTLTPREHVNRWFRERFSDYVQIRPAHYAPLKIHFDRLVKFSTAECRLEFQVYQPGLWLFDSCRGTDKQGKTEFTASIDGVEVNGQDAERAKAPFENVEE